MCGLGEAGAGLCLVLGELGVALVLEVFLPQWLLREAFPPDAAPCLQKLSACVCLYVYSFISTWWKHNGIDSFYYCALLWAKLNEKQRLAWLHVCV